MAVVGGRGGGGEAGPQGECAPAQRPRAKTLFSLADLGQLLVLLLLLTCSVVVLAGFEDGEPLVQAADALGLDESALGLKVRGERGTAAEAGGLLAPVPLAQEFAVCFGVPGQRSRVLAIVE